VAHEWERPAELSRLTDALRRTEPRPSRRWSELLVQVRQAQEDGAFVVR
jgi:hypothetical protein